MRILGGVFFTPLPPSQNPPSPLWFLTPLLKNTPLPYFTLKFRQRHEPVHVGSLTIFQETRFLCEQTYAHEVVDVIPHGILGHVAPSGDLLDGRPTETIIISAISEGDGH